MALENLPTPNFLIIGAQRSATRWLRSNLEEHPEIYTPSASISYFSDRRKTRVRTMRDYLRQFEAWSGEPFVGESSPSYLLLGNEPREVAARIHAQLPDVRLIAILRDPVDRMYSALLHHIKRGRLPADSDLFAMVTSGDREVAALDLIGGGLYEQSLRPYRDIFGDQLLILFHDDLRTDPAAVYEQAVAHIGASPGFVPSRLDRILFSNRRSVKATGPRLTVEQRRILFMLFRADVEELEASTGRFLPSWDPGPPPLGWRDQLPQMADVVIV